MMLAPLAVTLTLLAQTGLHSPAPAPADFGQWERLAAAGDRGGLSPDGRWLVYAINRTSGENEIRVTNVADKATKTIAFGAQPAFSADSKWLAVSVGVSARGHFSVIPFLTVSCRRPRSDVSIAVWSTSPSP